MTRLTTVIISLVIPSELTLFLLLLLVSRIGLPYRGKPWLLNHFVVIETIQQQHNSYLNFNKDIVITTSSLTLRQISPRK